MTPTGIYITTAESGCSPINRFYLLQILKVVPYTTMLRLTIIAALVSAAAALAAMDDAAFDSVLESPIEFGRLFEEFERENHRGNSAGERAMRFRAFSRHARVS